MASDLVLLPVILGVIILGFAALRLLRYHRPKYTQPGSCQHSYRGYDYESQWAPKSGTERSSSETYYEQPYDATPWVNQISVILPRMPERVYSAGSGSSSSGRSSSEPSESSSETEEIPRSKSFFERHGQSPYALAFGDPDRSGFSRRDRDIPPTRGKDGPWCYGLARNQAATGRGEVGQLPPSYIDDGMPTPAALRKKDPRIAMLQQRGEGDGVEAPGRQGVECRRAGIGEHGSQSFDEQRRRRQRQSPARRVHSEHDTASMFPVRHRAQPMPCPAQGPSSRRASSPRAVPQELEGDVVASAITMPTAPRPACARGQNAQQNATSSSRGSSSGAKVSTIIGSFNSEGDTPMMPEANIRFGRGSSPGREDFNEVASLVLEEPTQTTRPELDGSPQAVAPNGASSHSSLSRPIDGRSQAGRDETATIGDGQ